MKVAVLVSGRVDSAQGRTGLIRNNTRLKEKFPGADFYYGAWKSYKSEFERLFPNQTCEYFDEPVMHYHPYEISNKYHVNQQYGSFAKGIIKKASNREWTSHHTKQILIHAWLLDRIKKEYDVIIRTRFDAFIHRSADFTSYIADTFKENRANCFATGRKQSFAILYEQNKPTDNNAWHCFWDQLIIHPPSFITKQQVDHLHQEKMLHPAEFGWAQVLSYPYGLNHRAHKGWVNHDKNILDIFLKEKDK